MARSVDECERSEIEAAIHDEVERLPARYPAAVVLCLLEGLSLDQAAKRLDCPVGTVHSRLARGRERLRERLRQQGTGTTRLEPIPTVVSAALLDSTVCGAMGTVPGTVVSASVAALVAAVSRNTFIVKLEAMVATLLVIGAVAASSAVVAHQGLGEPKVSPTTNTAEPPVVRARVSAVTPIGTDSLGDPLPPGARLRLGTSRFRPPSIVSEMALSPDQKSLVTVGNSLIVWDTKTGKERWRAGERSRDFNAPGTAYGMRAVSFSADGSQIYTMKWQTLEAWDIISGRNTKVLSVPRAPNDNGFSPPLFMDPPRSVDCSPDGKLLAVGSGAGVLVCDPQGRILYEIANAPAGPLESPNTDRLTIGGHYSLGRFSPNGKLLAVVASDPPKEVRFYDCETGKLLRSVPLEGRLVRLAFSPDSRQLATTERDNALRLYDVESGKRVWSHTVKLKNIYENYTSAVAFSPDGKTLAAGATDHLIYLLNPATGEQVGQLSGHHWYPWALAFRADSKMLYSSGWDPAIRQWDVAGRKQVALPTGVRATSVVAASPDGQTLAYQDDAGTVRLVDAGQGFERRTLAIQGSEYLQLAFSPDGRRLPGGWNERRSSPRGGVGWSDRAPTPALGLGEGARSAFHGGSTLRFAGRDFVGGGGTPAIVGLFVGRFPMAKRSRKWLTMQLMDFLSARMAQPWLRRAGIR